MYYVVVCPIKNLRSLININKQHLKSDLILALIKNMQLLCHKTIVLFVDTFRKSSLKHHVTYF